MQMRKGILEYCILHIISRGEVYATDMIDELTAARMIVVEGTLYPLLTRLKNAGLLEYKWVESAERHGIRLVNRLLLLLLVFVALMIFLVLEIVRQKFDEIERESIFFLRKSRNSVESDFHRADVRRVYR